MISYYTYLPSKAIMVKFSRPCNILHASLSMFLYLHSALVKLLLANAIGLRMVVPGAVSFRHVIPSLVFNKKVVCPITDALA